MKVFQDFTHLHINSQLLINGKFSCADHGLDWIPKSSV